MEDAAVQSRLREEDEPSRRHGSGAGARPPVASRASYAARSCSLITCRFHLRVAKSFPIQQICSNTTNAIRMLGCENWQCLRSFAQ